MGLGHRLSWEAITLKLHHPFRLSTGVSDTRTAHWIRLENDKAGEKERSHHTTT